jgi:ubiquinol-cytochrome c reductase cytochrome c subunit
VLRRLLKSRYLLPAAVMAAVGLAAAASMTSGASAQGSNTNHGPHSATATTTAAHSATATTTAAHATPTTTTAAHSATTATAAATATTTTAGHSTTVNLTSATGAVTHTSSRAAAAKKAAAALACHHSINQVSFPGPANSGTPSTATYTKCVDGKLVSYGSSAITYNAPPRSYIQAGEELFEQVCSSCHQADAQGGPAAPSLIGVGPATVNFWVTTGRMPAATPLSTEAEPKPPRLNDRQAEEIAAFITSLTPSAPFIPTVHLKHANLAIGATLFALNCAACHTITGMGDALAFGTYAPTLHHATATQVAEAIRTGPGNMPRFTGNLSDNQVRDIVAYVTQKIQHPSNPGGFGLGGIGPVAEGFVALLFGVGGLMLVCFWIGDRS